MSTPNQTRLLRIAALSVISSLIGIPAFFPAAAQANLQAPAGAGSVQLQPYTAPDNSASAGVPPGWKVTDGTQTAITMSGPQGEIIYLGVGYTAHDGPFQAGQKGPADSYMTMPYSAKLTDKLIMILQQDAAITGKPAPQVKFLTAAPLQMPAALGQCGRFVIDISGVPNPAKGMGILCSLPADSSQFFKNFLMMGTAPSATAAQTAPIVQAVFASYKVPPDWLQKKLAPFTAPASAATAPQAAAPAQVAAQLKINAAQQKATDTSAECFDLIVIRETPDRQLPPQCRRNSPLQ
jgi:hypothetical protein